jgi:hypothetical protein
MRIDEVLRKENIGKKFKGFNQVWEVIEENDFGVYDITMVNVENDCEYIDTWNLMYEIVNENFTEVNMMTEVEQEIIDAIKMEYNNYREDEILGFPINFYSQGVIGGIKTCIGLLGANASEDFLKKLMDIKEMLYENLEEDMERCGVYE